MLDQVVFYTVSFYPVYTTLSKLTDWQLEALN